MIAHLPTPAPAHAGISERLSCSLAAAQRFQVPANVILAVATVENGRAGLWVPNANGSYDLGAMQLNTAYVATLARYGIRPDHVLAPGCYAYNLAAWRLHNHLAHDAGDAWQRVANYNSRTPIYNLQYQARLAPAAAAWRSWLEAYLPKMANIGGPELAAPAVPGPLVLQTAADRPKPSRAHRRNPIWQASLARQSCGVACAPMRVEMVFRSSGASSASSSPSG